jgi:DNA-binding LacI/PurR family transcriptional regulator
VPLVFKGGPEVASSPRNPVRPSQGGQARAKVGAGGRRAGTLGRPPVMADVAQLAGVSHQTVSRVLNDHPNVRQDTREKVLDAIRQLAYRPNAAARALVTRRTHTLGVIGIDSPLYGPAMMLNGIERAAQHGYFVVIASLPALDRRSMLDTVDRFLGHSVEGIIVIAPQTSAVAALSHVPADLPLIAVGCETRAPLTSVAVDNADGAGRATRYLLSLGHETVHHVAGPASWLDARERVGGWRAALHGAGAREPDVVAGDWSARSGYEAGQELARMDDVTAVFCGNDTMALGLVRALTEHGRRVPDDVSVVGFDDVPEAGYFLPPLTTVRQDFGELGRQALGALVDRIAAGPGMGTHLKVTPELTLRASAAPPPGAARPRRGPRT